MRIQLLLTILLGLIVSFLGVLPIAEQKPRRRSNRPPSIRSFTSSFATISICPFTSSLGAFNEPEVTLRVMATDPDGDSLHYEYFTAEGTISGKGKSVLWDLHGLPRGPHKVRVTVTDGKGGRVEETLTVTTVDSPTCDPPPRPCPVIKVACPDEMDKSKPFNFSATVEANASDSTTPSFYWTINAGRIIKGQHSREIEATTTGADRFEKITATVHVSGFDPSCAGTVVSCSTKIVW